MGLAASKQEAFWEACGFGHKDRVRRFIEQGIDVNWVSYTQDCCAIHVASQGKKEIVEMLIEANCDVNVLDDRGNLPLHHAAMKGHAEIMSLLIQAGSEINTQEKNGWTPLINAAYWCQPEAVQMLIQHRCDVTLMNKDERHALHEACRSQSRDEEGLATIAYLLIAEGCDINAKSSDLGEADFTALMFASYHGHPLVAKALIEGQCDVNAQGSNLWSALHWAADRGHVQVVKVLLDGGVDPLLRGRRGELAVDRTDVNAIKELLEAVAQPLAGERPLASSVTNKPNSPPRRRSKKASPQDMNAIFNAVLDRYKTKTDENSDKSAPLVKQSSLDSGNSSQADARRSPVTTDEGSSSGSSDSLSSPDTSPSDPGIKSTELYDTLIQDGDQSTVVVQDGNQSDTVETFDDPDSELNKPDHNTVSDANSTTDQDLAKKPDSPHSEPHLAKETPVADQDAGSSSDQTLDRETVSNQDLVKDVDSLNTQQLIDGNVETTGSQSVHQSSNTGSVEDSETNALNVEMNTLQIDNEILDQFCSDVTEESSVSSQVVDMDGECQMDNVLRDTAELDSQETREELSLPGGTAPTALAEDTDDDNSEIIDCNHDNMALEDDAVDVSTENDQNELSGACNRVHDNPSENTTTSESEAVRSSSENTQLNPNINCT